MVKKGLVELVLIAVLVTPIASAPVITNTVAYYVAKGKLSQYETVNIAIEAHERESIALASGPIHNLFFGIGENRAYRQYDNQYNSK